MMFLMAASLAMQAVPTVTMIERLSPGAAGDLALAGRDHGPIETVLRVPLVGPSPPGRVELHMVEQATRDSIGCIRQRWTVGFHYSGADPSVASLNTAHSNTEIALPQKRSCPKGRYVSLSYLTPAQAFTVLRRLDAIRSRAAMVEFTCSDETGSGLCATPRTIVQGLNKVSPWLVRKDKGVTILWMDSPGIMSTEVRWNDDAPEHVLVDRRIPAPF